MVKNKIKFHCKNCPTPTAGFMLLNHIWEEVADDVRDHLCVHCVEKKLGRKITAADLTNAPINYTYRVFLEREEKNAKA